MVCLAGLDRKTYKSRVVEGRELPEIACPHPDCGGERLRGHGGYRRYLDGLLAFIRRLRCRRCGVTHALLPEDVCAYQDLCLDALEEALDAAGPTLAARAAGESEGAAGVRRARRWRHHARAPWCAQLMALLPPAAGSWWQRARAVVGSASGALVRLRHWLWSTWGCFFGGLTGLYRYGRPRHAFRKDSTEVGICFSLS